MEIFIVSVFVLGYLAITLEHSLKIDKLIPALIMMSLAWAGISFGLDGFSTWFDSSSSTLMTLSNESHATRLHLMEETLLHHFGKTAEILIFLVGAMAIVELIDHFNGFQTIKKLIKTTNKRRLLWIVCSLGFVLSSIIDNLTATIVLITILRKIIKEQELRMYFAGLIIIAANAGGAWSPIGDVTTTMLWMNEKVTSEVLISQLFFPSVVCYGLPTLFASFLPIFKGYIPFEEEDDKTRKHSSFMLVLGLGMIIFVPVFKTITHLPPYIGMMLSLSIVCIIAEYLSNRNKVHSSLESHSQGPTLHALSKIEMPSILFFLGILMTVAALESLGLILQFGHYISAQIPENVFVILLGIGSAIIDNVPLVAASMGMFQEPLDDSVWHFIAFAAGTGGSMLIIGSAAGVVAMGMEKISFFWYLRNITWLAAVGYFAGAGLFLIFN